MYCDIKLGRARQMEAVELKDPKVIGSRFADLFQEMMTVAGIWRPRRSFFAFLS
jgi:hypothetical protein